MSSKVRLFLLISGLAGSPAAGFSQDRDPRVGELERAWLDYRDLGDRLGITRNLGAAVSPRGEPAESLEVQVARAEARVRALAGAIPPGALRGADSAAFRFLQAELIRLAGERERPEPATDPPDCHDPFPGGLRGAPLERLTARTFACYGAAARRIVVGSDTLDRLAILGLLGRTDDPARRERLFRALEPVWRSVNGDDKEESPYRRMVQLRREAWGPNGSPFLGRPRALGVHPDTLVRWLVAVLEGWRATMPDTLFEPWDFYYWTGETTRALSPAIPLDSLRPLADRFYRDLGADPAALRVNYDLIPRPGKYPISFTDFGGRNPVEPWIFTSYRTGGFDILAELLHELGHAVHIAAIRTRPAYLDWPDSDTFTEAIAELASLEAYEPAWQRRYLGRAAAPAASIRAKYAGVVLDVAWTLFEIRVHRDPSQSPNRVWTDLTREYLRIRPHPEWSWWALRGQLVGNPGYMMNYAFGAILIEDIRARLTAERGRFTEGDPGWYAYASERLYRFGRERPARLVVEEFLARPVSPGALLSDLSRGLPRPGGR